MNDGFPQFGPSAKQGNLGVGIVSRVVEDGFGWLFKRNHQEYDFGIDGQIEVVTDLGAVTGQMLACQIKCGTSFFRESNEQGFVYRGESKHFNYLAHYPLPVIVIIADPETRDAYWVQFQKQDAEITEASWKLRIPRDNKLSASKAAIEALLPPAIDHLSELREYWRINKLLMGVQTVLFTIEREEVEAGDISRIEDFRTRITSAKELALHCQGKIEFSFSGYDDDPRQLYEIDEVKRYIEIFDEAFPELFFFVRTEDPMTTLTLFLFTLFGVGVEGDWPNRKVIVDTRSSGPFLRSHFDSLNLISEWVGLPDAEIHRISKAVMKPLGFPPEEGTTAQNRESV